MNPEGVEEELYARSSGDSYEGREVDGDVSQDNGSSAQKIAALEAELADVKALNANIATAIRQIAAQFEQAMVAGIVENGTGGISDGWSQVGSYDGMRMIAEQPGATPDFVMTMGPVGEIVMLPLSERARNEELHRLHRAVLALRGILIGTGISTSMLDQIVGDLRCSSCHLTPIAPGSYQITEPVEDHRSLAQQVVDEYEGRRGRLVSDVAGLRQRETGEEALRVETGRSPRHQMKLALTPLFESWGIGGYDNDGLNDPLPSVGVLARIVVDLLDREGLLLKIYKAGLTRGIARGSHPGDDFGRAIAMQELTESRVKRMFEKYWLGR